LNVSSTADLIFIYSNYRTNAFGFLAGREVAASATSDANAGLLDQRAAVRWALANVQHFGGDSNKVYIWGQSAGGGSVVAQAIADYDYDAMTNGTKKTQPFLAGALTSSPYWPKTYAATSPETQWNYDTMVNRSGCAGSTDTLACLKKADLQTLREASLFVESSHTYTTSSYTWAPVIDGKFLPRPLTDAVKSGRINVARAFGMYNTHEGESFTPAELGIDSSNPNSTAVFDNWLVGFLPGLSSSDSQKLKSLYPAIDGSTETITNYSSANVRAGLVYRDVVLTCPAYWLAQVAPEGGWLGEYSINPAKHASDVNWVSSLSSHLFSTYNPLTERRMASGISLHRSKRQIRFITRDSQVHSLHIS
jgi:carboxylesterase type B